MFESNQNKAALVLQDGTVYEGAGFGPIGTYEGEAVFCTGMAGYTESMTDPSYHNQFLTFTYPLIGNYGVCRFLSGEAGLPGAFESDAIRTRGIIAHEICTQPSHWSCERSLPKWLEDEGIPCISGIDTRNLTKRLREQGVMPAALHVYEEGDAPDYRRLRARVAKMKDPTDGNLAGEMSTPVTLEYNKNGAKTVVLLDCGVKYGIIRSLIRRNLRVLQVRYDTPFDLVEAYRPSGVLVSNGPGNPSRVDTIQDTIASCISSGLPTFGICIGTQLISLSQGASTYKLKYGHRSQNQPCIEAGTKRCYITSQNHGYVVDPDSLDGTGLDLWFSNANDDSCEGVIARDGTAMAVQFHPEASPGPRDTNHLFDRFVDMMGD